MPIAIQSPIDGQLISYRAIRSGDALSAGEVSYSGAVPSNPVWVASSSSLASQSAVILAQAARATIINSSFTAITNAGLTVSGILASPIVLSGSDENNAVLTDRIATCKTLIDSSTYQTTDLISAKLSQLTDYYGVQHDMSVMTFMSVACSFVRILATLRNYRDMQLAAISAAPDIPTVQAVTWTTPTLPAATSINSGYNAAVAVLRGTATDVYASAADVALLRLQSLYYAVALS